MKSHRHMMVGLVMAGLFSVSSALAQTSVSVTKTLPVQPTHPIVTPPHDWKQWCDGQLAAARASQEGYANWRASLGLAPDPGVLAPSAQLPATGMTAATVQALGSPHVWPQPQPPPQACPLPDGAPLIAAQARQVGIYVVLPDPTLTYDPDTKHCIVCPEGLEYACEQIVTPAPH
jgi:hypothetical protein